MGSVSAESVVRVEMGGVGRADDMQSYIHMVAAGLGCKSAIVETRWANAAWTGLENATLTL